MRTKLLISIITALITSMCLMSTIAFANDDDGANGIAISPQAVNTGLNNGYAEDNRIKGDDPHFGWELGYFSITGQSDVIQNDEHKDSWTILKNTGDDITLWFHLNQDITRLHDNKRLSIAEDTDGYDERLGITKRNFKHGAVIIKFTDEKNKSKDPEVHVDYLSAAALKDTDTKVTTFQEGDYEVALDYEIYEDRPLQIFGFSISAETPFTSSRHNYRISFKFSVKNSDSVVYARDINTGSELSNNSYTEDGFYLDTANSKFLKVNLKREVIVYGVNGVGTEVKENTRVEASADRKYTEEGIYTITSTNEETGNNTEMIVYVGQDSLLKVCAETGMSIESIVAQQTTEHDIEDAVYTELIERLAAKGLYIEDVKVSYLSKEYLENLDYNSRENVYFGYKLSELKEAMGDKKYQFTLGKDGKTTVELFEEKDEYANVYGGALENMITGGGVVLICATASPIAATAGAPAVVSTILACAAKGGAVSGAANAAMGGTIAGIIEYVNSGSVSKAIDASILQGSESFKWGAIAGAVTGGAGKAIELKGLSRNGLTMSEAATLQKEKLPNQIIKNLTSMDEEQIYKTAGLEAKRLSTGEWSYLRKIDLTSKIDGKTNLERIAEGKAPIDPATGKYYELHHVGQNPESPLAILTKEEHMQGGNNRILHPKDLSNVEHGYEWTKRRIKYWNDYVKTAKELGWA